MDRFAIMVEAGYLYAQGGRRFSETKTALPRSRLSLRIARFVREIITVAEATASGGSLLRVYWYDGTDREDSLSGHQKHLSKHVKLRLGPLVRNADGTKSQKEVDALIVMDLVELARTKAVTDILLLASDRDIRPAVAVAQNYGVRVHLLGIIVKGTHDQSEYLVAEADTLTRWTDETLDKFLFRSPELPTEIRGSSDNETLTKLAGWYVLSRPPIDLDEIQTRWKIEEDVPAELDRELIGLVRELSRRQLLNSPATPEQIGEYMKSVVRPQFISEARKLLAKN